MTPLSVIGRCAFCEQLAIREKVRRTGMSRNNIRKYLREAIRCPATPSRIDDLLLHRKQKRRSAPNEHPV